MKTNFPKVFIVILTWNNHKDTRECLESLKKITYPNYGIIVVDNGSENLSAKKIQKEFPSHIYIYLKQNAGFSGGMNQGIKYALEKGSDYVLLLNNDTTVEPDFLDILVKEYENNPKIGIAAPKMNYYFQPDKIWVAWGYISRIRGCGFSVGQGKDDNDSRYNKNRFISFTSGCCLLIRKEVFNRVGLWDELYYSYTDDSDFCKRTTDAGFKILYVADSKIYHKVAVTNKKENPISMTYYPARNRLYFARKLLGPWFYPAFIYFLGAHFVKFIIWGIKGNKKEILATLDGVNDFFHKRMGRNRNYY